MGILYGNATGQRDNAVGAVPLGQAVEVVAHRIIIFYVVAFHIPLHVLIPNADAAEQGMTGDGVACPRVEGLPRQQTAVELTIFYLSGYGISSEAVAAAQKVVKLLLLHHFIVEDLCNAPRMLAVGIGKGRPHQVFFLAEMLKAKHTFNGQLLVYGCPIAVIGQL